MTHHVRPIQDENSRNQVQGWHLAELIFTFRGIYKATEDCRIDVSQRDSRKMGAWRRKQEKLVTGSRAHRSSSSCQATRPYYVCITVLLRTDGYRANPPTFARSLRRIGMCNLATEFESLIIDRIQFIDYSHIIMRDWSV